MKNSICAAAKSHPENMVCITSGIILYIINRVILKNATCGWIQYICRCHLNDLLCPFVVMPVIEILLVMIDLEWQGIKQILFTALICGGIWEYVIPVFKPSSVSDPLDIICYLAGAAVYALIVKRMRKKTVS